MSRTNRLEQAFSFLALAALSFYAIGLIQMTAQNYLI
jgi:hypothetical protein